MIAGTTSFTMTTFCVLVIPTVVSAKGGGFHGTLRGSGHRRRTKTRPPDYKRAPHLHEIGLLHLNPFGFHNVPRLEESVEVLVDVSNAGQKGHPTYATGKVIDIMKNAILVQYMWEGKEQTRWVFKERNFAWIWLVFVAIFAADWHYKRKKKGQLKEHYERVRRQVEEALEAHDNTTEANTNSAPKTNIAHKDRLQCGKYTGKSTESDGSFQWVETRIRRIRMLDGRIVGAGEDSRDGYHQIRGYCSRGDEQFFKWTEHYYDFETTVYGQVLPKHRHAKKATLELKCAFLSSRKIYGSATLALEETYPSQGSSENNPVIEESPTGTFQPILEEGEDDSEENANGHGQVHSGSASLARRRG